MVQIEEDGARQTAAGDDQMETILGAGSAPTPGRDRRCFWFSDDV
jgi:hypothetical protein